MAIEASAARVTYFRAYAEARAWGASRFTQGAPPGRFPVVIAMIEADDSIARAVPPQGISEGDDYRSPRLALRP